MQNLENSRFDKQNVKNSRFDIQNLEISRFDMQNLENVNIKIDMPRRERPLLAGNKFQDLTAESWNFKVWHAGSWIFKIWHAESRKCQDLTCRILKIRDLICRILKFQDLTCKILNIQNLTCRILKLFLVYTISSPSFISSAASFPASFPSSISSATTSITLSSLVSICQTDIFLSVALTRHFTFLTWNFSVSWNFCSEKSKSLQFLRKKNFKLARVGFDLGASALQCITTTPTPPRICWQWRVWFEYIWQQP